uniref:hypothetical protein RF1 n=1 Tax=Ceratocephala orthoceras TaxID=286838 RepID=UPI0030FE516F
MEEFMILKYFILGNRLSLCMKIINSAVVVGLYYGFMSAFSIGPSHFFVLRARIMEEGTEKETSAITGFIVGQLMMFISIYYAPMHLALSRPHTITLLVVPYILFHFFWNNHKIFFDSRSTTQNSMRNLSIQCVFLNNLISPLVNHFILSSSTLSRLVNIYMFRCNNKILFVTSSFIGWLIGYILFIKWIGLVLFWVRQNPYIRSNRYLAAELRNFMARTLSILLFITSIYYLGRMPSPLVTKRLDRLFKIKKKVKKKKQTENEGAEFLSEEKEDLAKIEETEEIRVGKTADEFNKDKYPFHFNERRVMTLLFDPKRWNRPSRYLKNGMFEKTVRNEMSHYFFYTCQSDGKQKISFTYPPSVSAFLEMIQEKMPLGMTEKQSYEESYNNWVSTNDEKQKNISRELFNRIVGLDKRFRVMDVLEKKTRFCTDENKEKCLPKIYDPLLNGPSRGIIKKLNSHSKMNEYLRPSIEDTRDIVWINKLHDTFFTDTLSEEELMDAIEDKEDPNDETISENPITIRKIEINKKIPRWSYLLRNSLQERSEDAEEEIVEFAIFSRSARSVVIYSPTKEEEEKEDNEDEEEAVSLIRYAERSDFRRDIIKGSMRAQRRKTIIWGPFQTSAHSPLFLDRITTFLFFSFDIKQVFDINPMFNFILGNWMMKGREFKITDLEEQETKEKDKETDKIERMIISEAWDNSQFGQPTRSCLLLIQSIFRKYIVLPSLIIAKNIGRMLLLQPPEWVEDWEDWSIEMHVKCTYNGVPLSETEFPKNWLNHGLQIKIFFPFRLEPWRRKDSKKGKKQKSCFLTVFGMEAERPFGTPRPRPSFFEPILKQLKKKLKKVKRKGFLDQKMKKKKTKWFREVSNETQKWVTKKLPFIKKIMKELTKKNSISTKNGLKEVSDLNSISNKMIPELSTQIQPNGCINDSLTEKKMKHIADRINKIRNQIEKTRKEKKKLFITKNINIHTNKPSWDDKRLKRSKNFWQILKKGKTRLIRKCLSFFNFWIKTIAMEILINIINNIQKRIQILLQLTKLTIKIIEKYSYKDERIKKKMEDKNENTIHYISTIKRSISNTTNTSNKSQIFCDLSSLSQAYLFYKLSQIQVTNSGMNVYESYAKGELYKILDSESRHQNFHYSGMNEWLDWLMGNYHYQYHLSQTAWSKLIPDKWQNKINKKLAVQKINLPHLDLHQKETLKQKNYAVNLLLSQKNKLKNYRYNLLANQYINYDGSIINRDRMPAYVCRSRVKKALEIFDNSNSYNPKNFDLRGDINLSNYLTERDLNMDRKYFDWGTLNFCLRKKSNIAEWASRDVIEISKNSKFVIHYYKVIEQIEKNKRDKKDFRTRTITIPKKIDSTNTNQTKDFFDWMGMNMNEEMLAKLDWPISNRERFFFPEFRVLYDTYKMQPWIIPINLLLLNKDININEKQEKDPRISYNQDKSLELKKKNRNKEEKQEPSRGNFRSYVKKVKKQRSLDLQKKATKKKKKKKSKGDISTELDFFLEKYFFSQLKLTHDFSEKMIDNIKTYSLLLRLKNPTQVAITSIHRKELSLDIMLIPEVTTLNTLTKRGLLIIEPIRLSINWDGQFIMYQIISISQVQKSKHQTCNKKKTELIPENSVWNSNNFLVPENIFSPRRRRELRIRICLNSRNFKVGDRNSEFCNVCNENSEFCNACNENSTIDCDTPFYQVYEDKNHNVDTNKILKLKTFLWPNYRLEDLACMNRYWFDTNNGSRFSLLRIHMYP